MKCVDDELEDLFGNSVLLADHYPRWRRFVEALVRFETNRTADGELPIYNERNRPKFAVGSEYAQQYKLDVELLAWQMLEDGIPNAEQYPPILAHATRYVDAHYAGEPSPGRRAVMREVGQRYGLPVSEAVRAGH